MSNDNLALTPEGLRGFNRWHWILMLILAALLLLLPLFTSIGPKSYLKCAAPAAPVAAAPVVAPPPPPVVAVAPPPPKPEPPPPPPAPALPPPPPAAKVFFASDKFNLPAAAAAPLAPIVEYMKANASAKAQVSGFHDPRGDKAYNEELALNRARSVRESLEKSGIDKARILMSKPAETTGTGPNPEARRVEVSIAP